MLPKKKLKVSKSTFPTFKNMQDSYVEIKNIYSLRKKITSKIRKAYSLKTMAKKNRADLEIL